MVEDGHRRRLLGRGLALALPLGWPAPVPALPATLKFAVSESWAPPYLARQGRQPVGGLLLALMHDVADIVGAPPAFVLLPNPRIDAALREGEVDLHPLISPAWYGPEGAPGPLGPPMVVLEDVLVTRDAGGPVDLGARPGWRVGTVLGYRYDSLQAAFEAGQLRREDAPNTLRMLEKLRLGRSDAAVCDRRVLQDFNAGLAPADRLHARQRVAQTVTHACVSPRSVWPQATLLGALDRVVSSGMLRRLLAGEG